MENAENNKKKARSLVNNYEVTLLEESNLSDTKNDALSEERISICFQTLDEIIPKLGIFQKVIKALRDDMFDSIFSDQYTTKSDKNNKQEVCRIPYFTLVKRIVDQRDEKTDELRDEIAKLKSFNDDKEGVIHEKDKRIDMLHLKLSLENSEKSKADMKRFNERKTSDLKVVVVVAVVVVVVVAVVVDIELESAFEESKALRVYKDGYDKLQDAFEDTNGQFGIDSRDQEKVAKKKFLNPRLEQVNKDITILNKLESQLHYVRNCVLEEHDDYMESKKTSLSFASHSASVFTHLNYDREDSTIERESRELARRQDVFKKSIADIKVELNLLNQQRELLEVEMNRLKADEAKEREIRKKKMENSKGSTIDSSNTLEEVDLIEIMAGKTDDPFIPHENILSKYSAMIYTSCNEGKTFYEMPDTKFCESCAAKTLMCPHVVTERERIFEMPRNCTHIKVTRPEIRIKRKKSKKKIQPSPNDEEEDVLLPRMRLVWEDYQRRTTIQRKVERPLSENSLYSFLFDRYLVEDVVHLSAHDIFTAIEKFAVNNKQVHLFAACLDGSIDSATFRYVLLMNEIIQNFLWTEMSDFSSFITVVYPFLQEEDMEQLRMGYTAFSENKISAELVHDYLLYIILTEKEPRFIETEVKLLQCAMRDPGQFTDIEFIEAMDSMVPLAAERLITRLYSQSLKHFVDSDGTVNVRHEQDGLIGIRDKSHSCASIFTLSRMKVIGAEMGRLARSRRSQEQQSKLLLSQCGIEALAGDEADDFGDFRGLGETFPYYDQHFLEYIEQEVNKFKDEISVLNEEDQGRCVLIFPPFLPRGRFLIHNWLSLNNIGLRSVSVGKDFNRRTVIFKQKIELQSPPQNSFKGACGSGHVIQCPSFNQDKSKCFIGLMEEVDKNLRKGQGQRRPDRVLYVPRHRKTESPVLERIKTESGEENKASLQKKNGSKNNTLSVSLVTANKSKENARLNAAVNKSMEDLNIISTEEETVKSTGQHTDKYDKVSKKNIFLNEDDLSEEILSNGMRKTVKSNLQDEFLKAAEDSCKEAVVEDAKANRLAVNEFGEHDKQKQWKTDEKEMVMNKNIAARNDSSDVESPLLQANEDVETSKQNMKECTLITKGYVTDFCVQQLNTCLGSECCTVEDSNATVVIKPSGVVDTASSTESATADCISEMRDEIVVTPVDCEKQEKIQDYKNSCSTNITSVDESQSSMQNDGEEKDSVNNSSVKQKRVKKGRKIKIHSKTKKDDKLKRKSSEIPTNHEEEPSTSKENEQQEDTFKDADDWDVQWNENGECLNEEIKTELKKLTQIDSPKIFDADKPGIDYLNYESTAEDFNSKEFDHLVEIYDFSPEIKTTDICLVLKSFGLKDFDINWVDDTHAIAVFASPSLERLLPYKSRPATTATVARNLVTSALGLRSSLSKEQRSAERQRLADARENKRLRERMKKEAWGD
eukprot:gene5469-6153_t